MKLRTNRLSFAALAFAAMGWSTSALACPAEPYISAVCIMGTTWAPQGYVAADGRQLAVSTNQALFALIGITYGGNGTNYFNVPDLRGRTVIGAGQGPDGTVYTTGQKGGQTMVTLTTQNVPLPPHVHGVGSLTAAATLGTLTAHTIEGKAERAYARGDALEKRRKLMEAWAAYCMSPMRKGEVVPMRAAR